MNSKWYISTLIILLALIGVLNQEQTKVANQQIVFQFTDTEMSSSIDQDDVLARVKQKLQALGIVNIEIIESDDTRLSLRYYSNINALSVEEFLSQDDKLCLKSGAIDELPSDFPDDELPDIFSIVVSDLQQHSADGFDLNGKLAYELNHDLKRFFDPVVVPFNSSILIAQNAIEQVGYKINSNIAIAIDNTSYAIPEVRAGPIVTEIV